MRLARHGRRACPLGAALAALAWCLLCWAGSAGRALALESGALPVWRLAVVVDCSQGMVEPWLGSTRLATVEAALQTELLSLPLRARAGVWLVVGGQGAARPFLAPRPALELRGQNLVLPQLGGAADLDAGLAQAATWLRSQGGGSLLILGGGGAAPRGEPPRFPDGERGHIFCHAVVLGPEPAAGAAWKALVLAAGGAYFQASRPDQIGPLLHRATMLALSPSRLLVWAHDPRNRPLPVVYGLERRDQLSLDRRAVAGRPCQILPGVYQLKWPAGSGLGPGLPPATASVATAGQSRLWAGGTGILKVKALDSRGRVLPWLVSVANLETGKVEASDRRTPWQAQLPAGFYRVKTTRPPLAWTVELGAGKEAELSTGPAGRLTVLLQGPYGPWRVPYALEDLQGSRQAGTGYTGSPLGLLPGSYRLRLQVVPPLNREFRLDPGQVLELEMPKVGGLLVRRDGAVQSQGYEVLDLGGEHLATGAGDRPLPLRPGRYQLRFPGQAATLEIEISPGSLTALDPPGASAH